MSASSYELIIRGFLFQPEVRATTISRLGDSLCIPRKINEFLQSLGRSEDADLSLSCKVGGSCLLYHCRVNSSLRSSERKLVTVSFGFNMKKAEQRNQQAKFIVRTSLFAYYVLISMIK